MNDRKQPYIVTKKQPRSYHSYRVNVYVDGEWVSNGLRFSTERQAELYATDLSARWTSVSQYDILPSEDEPNSQMLRYDGHDKENDPEKSS